MFEVTGLHKWCFKKYHRIYIYIHIPISITEQVILYHNHNHKKTVHIKYSESKWQYLGCFSPQTGPTVTFFPGICLFLVRDPWTKSWVYCHCYKQYLYYRGRLKFLPGGSTSRLPKARPSTFDQSWFDHTIHSRTKLLGLIDGGRLALRGLFHDLFLNPNNTPSPLAANLSLVETTSSVFFVVSMMSSKNPQADK